MIALVLALVSVVILLIDMGIKRAVVSEAAEASRLLDAAREVARGAQADLGAAGEHHSGRDDGLGVDASVAAASPDRGSAVEDPPLRGGGGAADGVRGDGQ